MTARRIQAGERFSGDRTVLRLVTLDDCQEHYLAWLRDPEVIRYLETRWHEQTLESIRGFVEAQLAASDSYLFAILEKDRHIGNIKVGPIHPQHDRADVSYFIGARDRWGRGLATDAIRTATDTGFRRLDVHRLQAGVYSGNTASSKALLRAGYVLEGCLRRQFRTASGWEDRLCYGILRDEWERREP